MSTKPFPIEGYPNARASSAPGPGTASFFVLEPDNATRYELILISAAGGLHSVVWSNAVGTQGRAMLVKGLAPSVIDVGYMAEKLQCNEADAAPILAFLQRVAL